MVNRATLALCLIVALPLTGEAVPSAEIFMDSSLSAGKDSVNPVEGASTGGIRFSLDSSKSDALRGSARVTVTGKDNPSLDRAYFKARFPWVVEDTSLRVTAGKAPLSWGKGFLFNAGDPIFGVIPDVTAISMDEYRTQTDWMGVLYLPVGIFSFAELVALPPVDNPEPRAGGRIVLAPRLEYLQSVEAGFLYERRDGAAFSSKAYLSVDGSLYVDWYAAVSAFNGEYAVSFGLLKIFRASIDIPLTLRMEGLVYPEETRQYWYPSLTMGLTNEFELSLQAILETGNATNGTGGIAASFTPLKGFTLSGAVLKQIEKGEPVTADVIVKLGCSCSF